MAQPTTRECDSWKSTFEMPFAVENLPVVRRRLIDEIRAHAISEDLAYDAALVLAELVGNALRHARPLNGGGLKLSWGCWDDQLHVLVTDGGAATEPRANPAGPGATSGRGLSIVHAVASEWGVEREQATTTVWASLTASGAGHGSLG